LTEGARLLALTMVLAIAAVACGRTTGPNGPNLATVVAGSVQLGDVQSSLDDSSNWWAGPSTYGARPLDISQRDDNELLFFTRRFSHVGTSEELLIRYDVWSSTALAAAIVTATQQAAPSPSTSPGAGDQVIYYNENLRFGAAPFMSRALVRVGQTVADVRLTQAVGFAPSSTIGKLALAVGSHLKKAVSGPVQTLPTSSPAEGSLPPVSSDIQLLGSTTLPVGAVAQMVDSPAPTDLVTLFGTLGVSNFVYGDYVLLADTHMEVQTAGFTFSSSTGASDWLNSFIGKANLDQNGDYLNFDQVSEQYIGAVGVGSHGALLICRSTADFEAASRACETPISRVLGAWKTSLPPG